MLEQGYSLQDTSSRGIVLLDGTHEPVQWLSDYHCDHYYLNWRNAWTCAIKWKVEIEIDCTNLRNSTRLSRVFLKHNWVVKKIPGYVWISFVCYKLYILVPAQTILLSINLPSRNAFFLECDRSTLVLQTHFGKWKAYFYWGNSARTAHRGPKSREGKYFFYKLNSMLLNIYLFMSSVMLIVLFLKRPPFLRTWKISELSRQ